MLVTTEGVRTAYLSARAILRPAGLLRRLQQIVADVEFSRSRLRIRAIFDVFSSVTTQSDVHPRFAPAPLTTAASQVSQRSATIRCPAPRPTQGVYEEPETDNLRPYSEAGNTGHAENYGPNLRMLSGDSACPCGE